jgi:hypothetical protein
MLCSRHCADEIVGVRSAGRRLPNAPPILFSSAAGREQRSRRPEATFIDGGLRVLFEDRRHVVRRTGASSCSTFQALPDGLHEHLRGHWLHKNFVGLKQYRSRCFFHLGIPTEYDGYKLWDSSDASR